MNRLLLSAFAVLAMTSASFAACKEYVTVTPDNAPVNRTKLVGAAGAGASPNYTGVPGQFGCPIKAAPGTCIAANRSLSDPVGNHIEAYITLDGVVADIVQHRNGIQVGPIFIPLTPLLAGAC